MRAPLLSDVIELLEVPYRLGGRDKSGIDCYGVLMHLYAKQGIALPECRTPANNREQSALIASQMTQLWERCEPEPGAGIALRMGRALTHVGMQIDHRRFVHAWEGSGYVVIDEIMPWLPRIHGFYRYVGTR